MTLKRLILGLFLATAAAVIAAAQGLGPVVPKATGDPHPEGNAFMVRNHMEMMLHDRDEVMYDGERPAHASIGECFDCHAVRDEAGTPVTIQDERHFCRACHDFAAVKVDCFDCHRSTPEDFDEPPMHATLNRTLESVPTEAQADILQAYLESASEPEEEASQ